jgi:CheY-like chemotaxis protein
MIKILIVDDNQNNRMLIRALVEDYCEDNDKMVLISEATNGLEASLLAEDDRFGLIFMDIMMPQMDGIEATQRIRSFDSKTMIVAVSAVDDGERQKQILSCGAEDYISKPINADIFSARLGNYFSLIESRSNPKPHFNPDAANVFSGDVFSRKVIFYIQNEDDLAQFWEYYLLDSDLGSEELSGCVRALYALGGIALKLGANMQMIIEESDKLYYMTMTEADKINSKILQLIMLKNPEVTEYKIENNKLSVRVSKPIKITPIAKPQIEVVEPTIVVQNEAPCTPYEYVAASQALQVYDFMEDEDFVDLQEYVGKLNTIMLIIGGGVEPHEVDEISIALQSIGRVASGYTDSYIIGQALFGLGMVIASHESEFLKQSSALGPLCAAVGRDVESWMTQTFTTGAPSVDYMNDTIVANAQMIESFLIMDDNASSDTGTDDIFDF